MYGIETFIGCLHSEKDIAILIDLCRNNMLPRVRRRLNNFERKKIRNGSIFVYEEDESKIKRWTDGKIWSPSRCSGLFLVYIEYLPRSVNSKVLVKKTITANLKGSVYHVIAYVNLDEELNGMCCLKYGNRLRIVHTHCQSIKNTQKENLNDNCIDEKRNDDCDLFNNNCQNDQNIDPYINQKQAYMNNEQKDDLQNIDHNILRTDNLLIEKQIKNDYERGNINSENETITKDHEEFTNFLPQTDMPIFQINDDYIFNDEYFYLENPLYKKMNQCNSIDSNENE